MSQKQTLRELQVEKTPLRRRPIMKEQFKFLGKICLWMVIGAAVGTLLSRSLLSESFLSMA